MGKIKAVISNCYGGFGLSPEAVKYLVQKKSEIVKTAPLEDWIASINPFSTVFEINVGDGFKAHSCLGDILLKENVVYYMDYRDRTHPDLVEVIEKFGEKAWGKFGALKIVEIPDDVDWEIQSDAGKECIVAKNKIWE